MTLGIGPHSSFFYKKTFVNVYYIYGPRSGTAMGTSGRKTDVWVKPVEAEKKKEEEEEEEEQEQEQEEEQEQ